ncbi:MAG TPA: sensor domain-containing diguanylate cyclase [Gaiellaceae bacterium]|nr:sensor domain-containing diguanylate cyclase [Gaiellaceae bacterium]
MPLFADTATWIAVGFAVGAALFALAASLAILVLVLRRGRAGGEARTRGDGGGPSGAGDAEALAQAREESRRARRLAEIASSIDLDEVLRRILGEATLTAGADAAVLAVREDEEEPLVAALGMTAEEAARQPVSPSPSGGARAVRLTYRYGPDDEGARAAGELIRGGVALPVRDDGDEEAVGTLGVFWRGEQPGPDDEGVARLEELAAAAAPAIRNAQRFREARRLADVDALTGLHNRRYFHEALARECARAQRYERRLALLLLDIDDFKEINDRVGHLAGDAVIAAVARRLRSAVRSSDFACRVGGDELAVLLPESGERDAEDLYRRIQFAVGSGSAGPAERVRLSAGIAELRAEDDPVSFFQRADDALYRAKQEGKGQVRRAGQAAGRP